MGNTAKQCRLELFQVSDFAGDLEDSKSTWCGILYMFGSHTFVPISWMCKKQTLLSHNSTEAERISLDAGVRMDGTPALDLWNLIKEVFHTPPKTNSLKPKITYEETRRETPHQTNTKPNQSSNPARLF